MATSKTMAVQGQLAHQRALAVVEKLGNPEIVEQLQSIPEDRAHSRFPEFLAALQATLLAALAEMAEAQASRITELEGLAEEMETRLAALEDSAPAAKSESPKATPKAAPKK